MTEINFQPEWVLIILGIIGICEGIKSFDKKQKLKKIYGLFPIIFGFASGFYLGFFSIINLIGQSLIFGGVAILLYEIIIKKINEIFGTKKITKKI